MRSSSKPPFCWTMTFPSFLKTKRKTLVESAQPGQRDSLWCLPSLLKKRRRISSFANLNCYYKSKGAESQDGPILTLLRISWSFGLCGIAV